MDSKTKLKKYCMNNRDYGFDEKEFGLLLEKFEQECQKSTFCEDVKVKLKEWSGRLDSITDYSETVEDVKQEMLHCIKQNNKIVGYTNEAKAENGIVCWKCKGIFSRDKNHTCTCHEKFRNEAEGGKDGKK